MAVRLSALRASHPLPSGRFLVLISVRGWVDPMVIVWLEGLGELKIIHPIKTQTHDLPACSTMFQPTTLPAEAYIIFTFWGCDYMQDKDWILDFLTHLYTSLGTTSNYGTISDFPTS
jgi:hypothetical protein